MGKKGWLVLEDGSVYEGEGFGAEKETLAAFVFNTGMTGHYGMLTDPVNAGLGIVTTFPVVGSWGAAYGGKEDFVRGAEAIVCRDVSFCPPNNNGAQDIHDFIVARGVTGLKGVDTRELTRRLRAAGNLRGAITFKECYDKDALIAAALGYGGKDLVKSVTVKKIERRAGEGKTVAVLDLGGAKRTADALRPFGLGAAVYPADTAAAVILKDKPAGVIITEGPGDPADAAAYVPAVAELCASGLPVFGIGLGHQLMAAARGFKAVKLPHGHRGANYPVKETATGKMYITAQNHGWAVDAKSVVKTVARISYENLHDGSVEGLEYTDGKCASLQFFPETGRYVLRPNAAFVSFIEGLTKA